MHISGSNPLLSSQQFDQLCELLQQIVQQVEGTVLTEQMASSIALTVPLEVDRFTLVISNSFSALLLAKAEPHQSGLVYQVSLTFESETITAFLHSLARVFHSRPDLYQPDLYQIEQVLLQPNDAKLQSEFTLKLMALLTTEPAIASLTEAITNPLDDTLHLTETALRQQIEQERLLNQVTTQIRQSLELPVILQTAVEQVQQCLQVDRLVIYRFDRPDAIASSVSITPMSAPEPESTTHDGSVIYEARTSEAIPSVLNFSEADCFVKASRYQDLLEQNLAIAVEDVNIKYALTPCLLNFLQQAQVRAKLIVPIQIHNQFWGLLIAHQCQTRPWQESEQRFLRQIAEHLAIAISQAQLYAEVQQQKQTLEQRVTERTQELHYVIQAAQSANRAKSEFLAAVSHELRTPLTCIIGMSATLQRWSGEALNDRQRNFLQIIHDSGEQLLALINDILDLSQAEAGKVMLSLSEFSLSRFAQQSLKAFEGQAALNEIALELDLRVLPQHDRFVADPRRVQQILFNLLDNAIKFTPKNGKVTLRVSAEENLAIFQVKDNGIGIPEHQVPSLFQKFQQLNAGHQRQYRGTGLGLALAKQLVELHEGWIDVESTVDVGSVFTIRLPRQRVSEEGSISNTRVTSIPNLVRGRIVLIEPREETADLICDVLTAAGYHVVWMLEGSTAVSQIEVLEPIVVIANVQLPDINGYNLIHRLRKNPITKHLKIMAIVPLSPSEPPKDWDATDADDYLAQPVRPDHLLLKVMALAESRHSKSSPQIRDRSM